MIDSAIDMPGGAKEFVRVKDKKTLSVLIPFSQFLIISLLAFMKIKYQSSFFRIKEKWLAHFCWWANEIVFN